MDMLLNADDVVENVFGFLLNGKSWLILMYEAESVSVIYPVGLKKIK